MIHNNSEIEQYVYDSLAAFLGSKTIGGAIYMEDCRPLDSNQEDAVIMVSPDTTAEQIQRGRVRINFYVPDIDAGVGRKLPKRSRLKELAALDNGIVDSLNEGSSDYLFKLAKASHFGAEEGIEQHYANITIDFKLTTF